ncbi:MAG TPA: hypothetical protein VHS33_08840 [Sphingomicrobium sp.]|nr:hypothetical protein [Sphingomicrobium sp.]
MHFRLPKPLHGWRQFAGEVGIIVLGVLIALGFGQIVELWQWHQNVATARQEMANELAGAAEQGAERVAIEDCLRDRIGKLAAKLNASDGRWLADAMPAPPGENHSMARVYGAPLRGWSTDSWDTAKSTGVLDHMHHEEVASYSAAFGEIAAIRDFQNEELPLESKLSFLGNDQQFDNISRVGALETLGQLDTLNAAISGLSDLLINQVENLHLQVDHSASAKVLQTMLAQQRKFRGRCVKTVQIQF